MSALFIITYAKAPLRFFTGSPHGFEVTTRMGSTVFRSEAEAWLKARQFELPEKHTRVEPLEESLSHR